MKHTLTYQNQLLMFCTALVIITSWNGPMVDSTNGSKRPDVNFYGELKDHTTSCKVEYILIGGKYEQIPFYSPVQKQSDTNKEQAKDLQIDPKQNKFLVDLNEVESISLKYPERPIEHELNINNRKYIEVEIKMINGSRNEYIVESNREISCVKVDKGLDDSQKKIEEERKLNMIHVEKLIIKGYKSTKDLSKPSNRENEQKDKVDVAQSTEKILDQIEEKVNNLPKEDPSNYEKVKQSLLTLLRSLRDQLQKMLGMIKG